MADSPLNMVPQIQMDPKTQTAPTQPSASDATTAAAAVSSNTPASYTSKTTISSLADLKRKAPKIYKFMMLSIAQNMVIDMQHEQDRLTQLWRDLRNNSNSQ